MTVAAPRTLLIVDDDSFFRSVVADDLGADGLEVLQAGSLAEARRLLRDRAVDVVLLDQRLPDGDGTSLCAEILSANEGAKIVFATAFPGFDSALAALRAGAFDYVSKPCEREALRLAVERSLRTLGLERAASLRTLRQTEEADATLLVGADGALAEVTGWSVWRRRATFRSS